MKLTLGPASVRMTPSSQNLTYYEDNAGEWRWRLAGDNGEIVADSAEGYSSQSNAKRGASTALVLMQASLVDHEGLVEALADYAHGSWSGWMEYLFSKCVDKVGVGIKSKNNVIPSWAVERWARQMNTPYAELPEEEKESDREEARKMLAIVLGESDA